MTDRVLTGRRILVVEDEYFIASDLKRALRTADAEVVGPVGNLAAGLELAECGVIDAAILDVNLEGDFSYELADRLTDSQVPYAFVTGYDDWAIPEQYRDCPRITKPFSPAAIVEVMARLVGPGDGL